MSRVISLNARRALDDGVSTAELEAVLVLITSPDGEDVIRLSTDPTDVLSVDPLKYGTRSTWLGSDPETEPFEFVLMGAQLPDDTDEGQGTVGLVFDMVDAETIELMQSFSGRAIVDLAVVLAGTPNYVEYEITGMVLVAAESQGGQLQLTCTANPVAEEMFPAPRMTRARFPGLFP